MKKFLAAVLALCMILSLASVSLAEPSVKVAAMKGPTAMGMVKMMQDDAGATYDFSIHAAIDEITPLLVKGEVDIAAIPANLSSVLYNNTKGQVKALAINTLGILYIVENGDTVKTIEDLRGRTIFASGKGATPEYALNYILSANGIDPSKDVTVEYKSEHSECLASVLANEGSVAMLPQPFVTTAQMKQPNVRVALDLNVEWDMIQQQNGGSSALVTGVVIARTDFINENPEAVAAFLEEYKASSEYTATNLSDCAVLVEKYGIVPKAAIAEKAIPYCNISYIDGTEMKDKVSGYLGVLFEQNPQSVGGALPGDDFYYGA